MYIALDELYTIHDSLVKHYDSLPWYRPIKKMILAQRAYVIMTLIDLVHKRLEDYADHQCGPSCKAGEN